MLSPTRTASDACAHCRKWPQSGLSLAHVTAPDMSWRPSVSDICKGVVKRHSLQTAHRAPVDNFAVYDHLSIAQKLSNPAPMRNLLNSLNIPINVLNVVHIAHFIRRALC